MDEESDLSNSPISKKKSQETKIKFSFQKLWLYTGPGFLMSIAFLDPGNIEADLQTGFQAGHKLLWILVIGHIVGLLMQRYAARLGVVTGFHLAEVCRREYPAVLRYTLWIMMEIAIIGADMQEVIGSAIAIFLLTRGHVSLSVGVVITIANTFVFLFVDRLGIRKLEFLFFVFIGIMAASFAYEFFTIGNSAEQIISGMIIPWCKGCSTDTLITGVGLLGSIIMPHNLYLHSALVKSREIPTNDLNLVREGNFYFLIESSIALLVSFFINLFVVGVFAELLGHPIPDSCIPWAEKFSLHLDLPFQEISIFSGGVILGCTFTAAMTYVWGVGILASGQSSTMTGTYAGQFVMEGFINFEISPFRRVLLARAVAIGPTILVALYGGMSEITKLNDTINVIQAIQLPFAAFPLLHFTNSSQIMGEFANGILSKVFSSCVVLGVLMVNIGSVVGFLTHTNFQIYQQASFIGLAILYGVLVVLSGTPFIISLFFTSDRYARWQALFLKSSGQIQLYRSLEE